MRRLLKIVSNQRGATTAEYAVILIAVVIAVLVTVFFLERQTSTAFNLVGGKSAQFGRIAN